MMTYLIYSAKVAVLMIAFYTFYRLLLSRETLHRMNRIVLLSTAVLSFVLPLCIITMHRTEWIDAMPVSPAAEEQLEALQPLTQTLAAPWWQTALMVLYFVGCFVVICKILMSLFSLLRLIRGAQDVREYQGHRLIILDREMASFSWMNHIIIGRDDYERGVTEILEHESAHIALGHSWDVLLVDLISAIQWFNPAIWLLRSDLRAVHEYEADEAVLQKGVNVKHYQYLLISKALATSGFSITNQFNHSKLTSRINMMTKKKSSVQSVWKVLYILPIVALSLAASAKTVINYEYKQPSDFAEDQKSTQEKSTEPIEKTPDVLPEYPDGTDAMWQYLMKNFKYPQVAAENGYAGRVLVKFVVEKDGSITNLTAYMDKENGPEKKNGAVVTAYTKDGKASNDEENRKAAKKALLDEATRVVSQMPKWKPAEKGGKKVRSEFVLPVMFRLN